MEVCSSTLSLTHPRCRNVARRVCVIASWVSRGPWAHFQLETLGSFLFGWCVKSGQSAFLSACSSTAVTSSQQAHKAVKLSLPQAFLISLVFGPALRGRRRMRDHRRRRPVVRADVEKHGRPLHTLYNTVYIYIIDMLFTRGVVDSHFPVVTCCCRILNFSASHTANVNLVPAHSRPKSFSSFQS